MTCNQAKIRKRKEGEQGNGKTGRKYQAAGRANQADSNDLSYLFQCWFHIFYAYVLPFYYHRSIQYFKTGIHSIVIHHHLFCVSFSFAFYSRARCAHLSHTSFAHSARTHCALALCALFLALYALLHARTHAHLRLHNMKWARDKDEKRQNMISYYINESEINLKNMGGWATWRG